MSEILRFSTKDDLPSIQSLMQATFNDSDRFIQLLFSHLYHDNVLLCEKEQGVVAMAFLLPAYLTREGRLLPATYLYACATDPRYRGQGVMGRIINKVCRESCDRKEAAVLLLPAEESLYSYYGSLGFQDFFYQDEETHVINPISSPQPSMQLMILSPEEYFFHRVKFLPRDGAVHYPLSHYQFFQEEDIDNRFYLIEKNGKTAGVATVVMRNEKIEVREWLAEPFVTGQEFADAMQERYDCTAITLIQPGSRQRSAMIHVHPAYRHLLQGKGYFNFGLD